MEGQVMVGCCVGVGVGIWRGLWLMIDRLRRVPKLDCVCWEAGCGEVGVPRVVYEGVFLVCGLWEFSMLSCGWE